MSNSTNEVLYGNARYWCFFDEKVLSKKVGIWTRIDDKETLMAVAEDKYQAKFIIDALLAYPSLENVFGKKELAFLDFVKGFCPEPYATIAANTILWNDVAAYKKLRDEFPVIYS